MSTYAKYADMYRQRVARSSEPKVGRISNNKFDSSTMHNLQLIVLPLEQRFYHVNSLAVHQQALVVRWQTRLKQTAAAVY